MVSLKRLIIGLVSLVFIFNVFSIILTPQTQAVQESCFLWVFNCQEKDQEEAVRDIFDDIDLQEAREIPNSKQEEIQGLLRSNNKEDVEKGFQILFDETVRYEYERYIAGKADKEDTEKLRKFYSGIETARNPIERDFSPMVNTWGMLTNGMNFGTYIISSLFLDIQTQIPDPFGKFDYKNQDQTMEEKARQAINPSNGKPLRLDSIDTVNFNIVYYRLLVVVVPLFAFYIFFKYARKLFYSWDDVYKIITEVIVFLLVIVMAPSFVSTSVLVTNSITSSTQQAFSDTQTIDVCEDDRTLTCAYRVSFVNQATEDAIYAYPEQFYTSDEDAIKYTTNLISEFTSNFFMILMYIINLFLGIAVLFVWKGSVLFLLVSLLFLVALLPFAMIEQSWRWACINKLFSILLTVFGFTLCYNLATQLVLAVSTGGFAFWSISFILLIGSFLLFQAVPMIGQIMGVNLRNNYNQDQAVMSTVKGEYRKFNNYTGVSQVRDKIRKSSFGKTKLYQGVRKGKNFLKGFGKKK